MVVVLFFFLVFRTKKTTERDETGSADGDDVEVDGRGGRAEREKRGHGLSRRALRPRGRASGAPLSMSCSRALALTSFDSSLFQNGGGLVLAGAVLPPENRTFTSSPPPVEIHGITTLISLAEQPSPTLNRRQTQRPRGKRFFLQKSRMKNPSFFFILFFTKLVFFV